MNANAIANAVPVTLYQKRKENVKNTTSKDHNSVLPQERLDRDLYVQMNWANIDFARQVGKCT